MDWTTVGALVFSQAVVLCGVLWKIVPKLLEKTMDRWHARKLELFKAEIALVFSMKRYRLEGQFTLQKDKYALLWKALNDVRVGLARHDKLTPDVAAAYSALEKFHNAFLDAQPFVDARVFERIKELESALNNSPPDLGCVDKVLQDVADKIRKALFETTVTEAA